MKSLANNFRGSEVAKDLFTQTLLQSLDLETIRRTMALDPRLSAFLDNMQSSHCCQDGHCERPDLYEATLRYPGDLYVFTGEKDLQTAPGEALTLK